MFFPRNFSLINTLFLFSSLSSFFVSPSALSSPKFLTWFTLTHLHCWSFTRPLSHLSSWIGELGLDRWAGIGWWWVWNSGSFDRWVDRLGWSSVAPMVAPMMIFFNGFAPVGFKYAGFEIGGVGFWSVAWVVGVVGVVAVVGSNWFDGLCVCGSVDVWWFVFVCVALLMV